MRSGNRPEFEDQFTNKHLHKLPFFMRYRHTTTEFTMDAHSHRGYELFFLHEGSGHYINGEYVHTFHGNDLILIDGQHMHRSVPTPGNRFTRSFINFLPECLTPETNKQVVQLFGTKHKAEHAHFVLCKQQHARIYALLVQMRVEYESRQTGFVQMICILLTRLLEEIHFLRFNHLHPAADHVGEYHPVVRLIIDYLSVHYAETISLEALAKHFYISPYYLCRLFKKTTGETVTRFIAHTRVCEAKHDLVFTDLPISEICSRIGFTDSSYFGLVFKQFEGMSPKEYRKMHRQSPYLKDGE
ncbi:helix-turn-helix transcriptional regulator [Paenibacillus hodogayensis]|uniref:Helix-turn-helix transcriptional regulator n=1 Tax=Paenibacillus hodogayensis TaxID=279208 RepID=A0ABV5VPX9_9BACL